MKRVVSVSIGSSKRDHAVNLTLLGQDVRVERIGTDGDLKKAADLISHLDGKVDAFGMGGIDLYVWAGRRRYIIREAKKLAKAATKTPILDGSGLKNTLERHVIKELYAQDPQLFHGKHILVTSSLARFGMSEELLATGGKVLLGDLIFLLGLNIPIYKLSVIQTIAALAAPLVVQLPFKMLYPTGNKQDKPKEKSKFSKYYEWADIISGDFHMLRKDLPLRIDGKTIITNTLTPEDVDLLKARGCVKLVSTTPEFEGRSFGTNVMEALVVALLEKPFSTITQADYVAILGELGFTPRVIDMTR